MAIGEAFAAAVRNYRENPSDGAAYSQLKAVTQHYRKALLQQYTVLHDLDSFLDDKRRVYLMYREKGKDAFVVPIVNTLAKWLREQLVLTGANPWHYRQMQATVDFLLESEEVLGGMGKQIETIQKTMDRIINAGRALARIEQRLDEPPLAVDVEGVCADAFVVYRNLTAPEGLFPRK